jgi:hypothetical protein
MNPLYVCGDWAREGVHAFTYRLCRRTALIGGCLSPRPKSINTQVNTYSAHLGVSKTCYRERASEGVAKPGDSIIGYAGTASQNRD